MLRRALTASLVVLVAALVAGCAGITSKDGRDAEQLLQQAQEAQAQLESMTFRMSLTGDVAGQGFTMRFDGGGYLKGEHAGDFVMRGSMEGPGVPATDFRMVMQGGRMWMGLGGQWQEIPIPEGTAQADAQLENQLAQLDFSQFVTEVEVDRDTTFLGEPVTKIVGVIDTAEMVDTFLGQFGGLNGSFGSGLPADFSENLGDTRVVIYVSDTTHVVQAARITISLEAEGETATMNLDYFLTGVNEPVEIPTPTA
jgi:outer membrane lipoprotein-sorting protein